MKWLMAVMIVALIAAFISERGRCPGYLDAAGVALIVLGAIFVAEVVVIHYLLRRMKHQ